MPTQPTITKNINGSYTLSDIIDGYWINRTYYGYSLKECKAMFTEELNEAQ